MSLIKFGCDDTGVRSDTTGILIKWGEFGHRRQGGKTQGEDGHLQTKERGLEETHPSQPSEGTSFTDPGISDSASRTGTQCISVVEAPQFPGLCYGSLSRL